MTFLSQCFFKDRWVANSQKQLEHLTFNEGKSKPNFRLVYFRQLLKTSISVYVNIITLTDHDVFETSDVRFKTRQQNSMYATYYKPTKKFSRTMENETGKTYLLDRSF